MSNLEPVRCYFAAVHAPDWLSLSPVEWDAVVECGIAGVDVRISSPRNGPSKSESELARRVRETGLEVRCHGWVGRVDKDGFSVATGEDGYRDGWLMGAAAQVLQASVVGMNAEKDVWRWRNGKANPYALDFYRGFHAGALRTYPLGRLQDVGFRDPREHYDPKADLDGNGVPDALIPRDVAGLFDLKGVMAYQSSESIIKRGLARAREIAGPGVPMAWWGGIGRISPKTGQVGDYYVTLKGCRERWSGIDEWVGYVGFTERGQPVRTIDMLTKGHERHPPLVQLVRAIRGKVVA